MSEASAARTEPAAAAEVPAERPIDVIARIGRARYGQLWVGKTALDLAVPHQTIRRWLAGKGAPSAEEVQWLKYATRQYAAHLLRAAGDETP